MSIRKDPDEFWRTAERCFARTVKTIPQARRFAAAALIARAAVPLFRKTSAYREQQVKNFHNDYEISLHLVLNALTKNDVTFDPPFVVKGYEHCKRALSSGKGVLVIGHHAALTVLMVRYLYDKGLNPIVLTPDNRMRVGGKNVIVRTIQKSPYFLLNVRSSLRRGEVICAMPDRAEAEGGRTFDFNTPNGRVIVAPALMQVAARCGAEVIFAKVHAERNSLLGTISAPSPTSDTAGAITDDFVAFVRASVNSTVAVNG